MDRTTDTDPVGVSRRALWFGLLGGAVAWTLHLMGAYAIAEFGCLGVGPVSVGGITTPAALLIALSVVCLGSAVAATVVAYRGHRRLCDRPDDGGDAGPFIARTGLIASGLFAFIILVESVPIVFFLNHC